MRNHTRPVLAALADMHARDVFHAGPIGRRRSVHGQGSPGARTHGRIAHLVPSKFKHAWPSGRDARIRDGRLRGQQGGGWLGRAVFRFPYLRESAAVLDRARKRNIATFWIDVDFKDFLTRSPQETQRRVMTELSAKGKGVILMHDIQPSTVGAIAPLLDEMRRKGYKVVHLTPKAPASTVAEFDAAAAKAFADKSKGLQSNPLADRSVVWPSQGAQVKQAATGVGDNAATSDEEQLPWPPRRPEQQTSQTGATPSKRGSRGTNAFSLPPVRPAAPCRCVAATAAAMLLAISKAPSPPSRPVQKTRAPILRMRASAWLASWKSTPMADRSSSP